MLRIQKKVYISKEISDTYNTEEECMMEGVSNHIIEEYTPLFRKKNQVVKIWTICIEYIG